ncbi:hypothetical protein AB0M31_19090 [Streptomyces sp. NPDC051773]|uniref:hypothetical protein n=1 Tax=Streptomyces sp. NPDC051773 TaxID=3156682 RepID=UPI003415E5CD
MRGKFRFKGDSLIGAIILSLAMTSCGIGDGDSSPDPKLSAEKACEGLSPAAASALEDITETEEFESRWDSAVASLLKKSLKEPGQEERNELLACEIIPQQPKESIKFSKISFLFEEVPELPPSEDELWELLTLPIGLRATASDYNAEIYFSCDLSGGSSVQKKLPVIRGELLYGGRNRKKDPRPGNIKVLQDISYKIAKGMGCANNGDIPEL